jgi:Ribonuclease toxin, BrnT, of type II toxin-antitoxin system
MRVCALFVRADRAELSNTEVSSGAVISERFEWDDAKAEWNEAKHGIAFPQAEQIFDDPLHATMSDARHAEVEDRYITIGEHFGAKYWSLRTPSAVTAYASLVHGAPRAPRNDDI